MFRNYLLVAFRNLRKHPGYSFINVFGLALGVGVCLLMALFVRDELSYDRFHEHADRIAVVAQRDSFGGEERTFIATPFPLARALESEIPEVEQATHLSYTQPGRVKRSGAESGGEADVLFADPGFFGVFSFRLLRGDPASALEAPFTAVVTPETARRFFGNEDPVGQHLVVGRFGAEMELQITGIIAAPPATSSVRYDLVASISSIPEQYTTGNGWGGSMYQTFALLRPGASAEELAGKLPALVEQHMREGRADRDLVAVPLTGLYLSQLITQQGFKGDPKYLYLFSSIALFILLIACINYMNLATARSMGRAKEVGVRKSIGAQRAQVAGQFLGESLVVAVLAFGLALGLAALALPSFNGFFGKSLDLHLVRDGGFVLALFGATLLVGLLAGSYPAFFLSGFRPVSVLKAQPQKLTSGGLLRKGLVVAQFTITLALMISTGVVYEQLRFASQRHMGFEGEQVVVVTLPNEPLQRQHAALKQAFLEQPGVLRAAATSGVPGRFNARYGFHPDPDDTERMATFWAVEADPDFLPTLGFELVAGRLFDPGRPADETKAFILNEAGVAQMQWEDPIGQAFEMTEGGEVIGVVKDFHFASMREKIGSVAFRVKSESDDQYPSYSLIAVKISPDDVSRTLGALRAQWGRFTNEYPFEYRFLDEEVDRLYRTEQQLGQAFGFFAGLGILIAALGLFGLAAFTAEQRTKEIGVRKVLGASVGGLVALLSKDYLGLVLVSFVIASPVAYYAMQKWLEGFAYRVEMGPALFLLAGLAGLLIALLTVSYQAIRAATADPVKSLRYE